MTIKQLFAVNRDMILTLKVTAAIVVIVVALVIVSINVVGGICGILLMAVGTVLIAIGSINYLEHNN